MEMESEEIRDSICLAIFRLSECTPGTEVPTSCLEIGEVAHSIDPRVNPSRHSIRGHLLALRNSNVISWTNRGTGNGENIIRITNLLIERSHCAATRLRTTVETEIQRMSQKVLVPKPEQKPPVKEVVSISNIDADIQSLRNFGTSLISLSDIVQSEKQTRNSLETVMKNIDGAQSVFLESLALCERLHKILNSEPWMVSLLVDKYSLTPLYIEELQRNIELQMAKLYP